MAEKQTGPVRFDDFIDRVHADPANTQPRVLLTGFVGRSDTEGNVRIYSDPGLSQWIDAPAEAIVHAAPIADSPLGGSHVWLDATAELKPGYAGAVAAAAGGGEGGLQEGGAQAVGGIGADTGLFNPFGGGVAITRTFQFPCHTLGFTCTLLPPCPVVTQPVICDPLPTRNQPCTILCTQVPPCPPRTSEFICPSVHAVACPPTRNLRCEIHTGFGCPVSISCPPQGGFPGGQLMQGAAAPTQGFGCPDTRTCTPPTHMLGCPGTSTCTPPTHMMGCPNTSTCTPGAEQLGGYQTTATVCTQFTCHTQMLGCPATSTCPPGGAHSAATVCTQVGCVGPTGWQGCGPQVAQQPVGPTGWQGCRPPIGPTAWLHCPQTTMLGCPPTSTCPPGGQFPTLPPACPMTGPTICPPSVGCYAGPHAMMAQTETIAPPPTNWCTMP